jgi:hypothetical protein
MKSLYITNEKSSAGCGARRFHPRTHCFVSLQRITRILNVITRGACLLIMCALMLQRNLASSSYSEENHFQTGIRNQPLGHRGWMVNHCETVLVKRGSEAAATDAGNQTGYWAPFVPRPSFQLLLPMLACSQRCALMYQPSALESFGAQNSSP